MSTSYSIRRYLGVPDSQHVVLYNKDAREASSVVSFGSGVPSTVSPGSSVSAHSRREPNLSRKRDPRQSDNGRHHAHLWPSRGSRSSHSSHSKDTSSHQSRGSLGSFSSSSSKSLVLVAPSVTGFRSGAGLSIASRGTVKSFASSSSRQTIPSSTSASSCASGSTIKAGSRVTVISTRSRSRTPSISSISSSRSDASTKSIRQSSRQLQVLDNSIVLTLPCDEARLAAYITYFVRVKKVDPAAAMAYLATRRDCTAAACHLGIMAAADDGGARLELFMDGLLRKHKEVCHRVIWMGHRGDEELEHWLDDLRADRENWPRSRGKRRV